jgi:hypothetical protein
MMIEIMMDIVTCRRPCSRWTQVGETIRWRGKHVAEALQCSRQGTLASGRLYVSTFMFTFMLFGGD